MTVGNYYLCDSEDFKVTLRKNVGDSLYGFMITGKNTDGQNRTTYFLNLFFKNGADSVETDSYPMMEEQIKALIDKVAFKNGYRTMSNFRWNKA